MHLVLKQKGALVMVRSLLGRETTLCKSPEVKIRHGLGNEIKPAWLEHREQRGESDEMRLER